MMLHGANKIPHFGLSLPHEASGHSTTNVGFLTQNFHTSGDVRANARQCEIVEQVRP